jgi:amidohydrolase
VFTICHFKAGETFNVFPDNAILRGTIRSYDEATCDLMHKRIEEICSGIG